MCDHGYVCVVVWVMLVCVCVWCARVCVAMYVWLRVCGACGHACVGVIMCASEWWLLCVWCV